MKTNGWFLLQFLLLNVIGASGENTRTDSANVRVVFPFEVTNVVLHLYNLPDSVNHDLSMVKITDTEYTLKVLLKYGVSLFNIEYDSPVFNIDSYWIGSGKSYNLDTIPNRFDAHGLKYGMAYVNDFLLDNTYTVNNFNLKPSGQNISFKVLENGTVAQNYESFNHPFIDSRIPSEVHHRYSYWDTTLPKPEHITISGWGQAISNNAFNDTSWVELDYLRMYGINDGSDPILLEKQEYDNYSSHNDGGLYFRFPFFPKGYDSLHTDMPGSVSDGVLTISPSNVRDKVWHWWTPRAAAEYGGFQYQDYRIECRIRVTGHALVQLGIDFRVTDDAAETNELGVSDWCFDTNGEWDTLIFDTRTLRTVVRVQQTEVDKRIVSFYYSGNNLVMNYSGMEAGKYCLTFYSLEGKVMEQSEFILTDSSGNRIISMRNGVENNMIFDLSNPKISLRGKVSQLP